MLEIHIPVPHLYARTLLRACVRRRARRLRTYALVRTRVGTGMRCCTRQHAAGYVHTQDEQESIHDTLINQC